ncbi:hypothetical protein P3T24_005091 [Paraburkholderia sp. GAS33]|uniref:hypothetical protein n=1 Tax=Paraburkholderia sp. GAS33 TaxID=3035130 RepID=UPI003D23AB32
MHIYTTLRTALLIAPAIALGVLLGGCDRLDTSKPNDAQLNTAVQAMDGTCRQWTVGDIKRLDGVPIREPGVGPMYAIKFSAVVTLTDPDQFRTSTNEDDFAGCPTLVVLRIRQAMNSTKTTNRYQVLDAVPLTQSDSGWHMLNRDYVSADVIADTMRVMNMGLNFSGDQSPITPLYGDGPVAVNSPDSGLPPGLFHRLGERIASLFQPSSSPVAATGATSNTTDTTDTQPSSVATGGASQVSGAPSSAATVPSAQGSSDVAAFVPEATAVASDSASATPATSEPDTSVGGPTPKFADYPSGPLYNGPVHALVPDEFGKEYRTNLSAVLDYYAKDLRDHGRITQTQGIVAGHYAIATWGCGTGGCITGGLVDLKTGEAYELPVTLEGVSPVKPEYRDADGEARPGQDEDLETRPDSRLMVVAGVINDGNDGDDTVKFIEFTGSGFRTILSKPWGHAEGSTPAPAPGSASAAPVADALPQAAKLQLLLQKAQDQFHAAQYGSAVATAEAILLLDPSNTQAKQLRARALRSEQEALAKVAPPQAIARAQTQTSTPAPTTPPAPQPANRTLVLADLEGDWHGIYECGAFSGSGSVPDLEAWSHHVRLTVRNGRARLVRQSHGDHPYREVLSGTVANDLTLRLGGTGQYADAQHAWTTAFTGQFAGTTEQPAFQADGALTNWRGEKTRTCHLALGR